MSHVLGSKSLVYYKYVYIKSTSIIAETFEEIARSDD